MKNPFRRQMATTVVTGEPLSLSPRGPSNATRRSAAMIVVAALLATLFVTAVGVYLTMRPATLRVAVGPANSNDVRIIQAAAQVFARDRGNVRLRVTITDGVSASADAVDKGTSELAVIRGDQPLPKNAQAVAILRKNIVTLWVPAAAPVAPAQDKAAAEKPAPATKAATKGATKAATKAAAKPAKKKTDDDEEDDEKDKAKKPKTPGAIEKIEDLTGKRIAVIGRTDANPALLKMILAQYGIGADKVTITQIGTGDIAENIRQQKADAFMAVGPANSKITAEAIRASSRDGAPTFLAIDAADAIAEHTPAYEATEITAGSYGGAPAKPSENVKTISFAHYIAANRKVSETTIAAFARALFTARQSIAAEAPDGAKFETPDTDKDAAIPVHPGAAAYVDGDEKTFFDRYSDLLYWGLMVLSAAGSAGAWFGSYLKRDERNLNTTMRERLLGILQAARNAKTAEELDALQSEADEILRATLENFEAGNLEETDLTAFSIALNQAHSGIADRRAVLAQAAMPGGIAPAAPARA